MSSFSSTSSASAPAAVASGAPIPPPPPSASLNVGDLAEKRQARKSFTNVVFKNIREDVTDEQLAAAVASCGKITSAVVHRDANGKSKRHGYVNFETPESAVKMIEQFNDSETLASPGEKIFVGQHLK